MPNPCVGVERLENDWRVTREWEFVTGNLNMHLPYPLEPVPSPTLLLWLSLHLPLLSACSFQGKDDTTCVYEMGVSHV